ncbi:ABC transporter permease subunit [Saccharothrix algeriensis]|uniref:ABC transporter permease n=1 Tax=Saccharothrix algeriensis TaxID=173560 RepID=A0A8T8HZI9_9PSEU|nr:ABC transporter permease [Saccharothrix algeriensis]MBM7809485.1 ABC-type transport system involved in multi-copper enzyme maturation permease subunit [Saccharothrix algeriensis]QTR03817.1 ABC transporter permease [Saccharothrix algeriensis]
MTDVLASEFLKLRTVRSTAYLLLSLLLVLAVGILVAHLMTADYDVQPPERQAKFAAADPGVMVAPFGQFVLGVLGALAVTSEYGSGMIRTALASVPRRRALLLAKVAVVGAVAAVVGGASTLVARLAGALITGDRPKPIAAFDSFGEALPALAADTATTTMTGLVGLGLGFLLRSTAGAVVTLSGLLFVLPMVSMMLPSPWDDRVVAVLPLSLASQLTGQAPGALLSPWGAGAVVLAYVVVALGGGLAALLRRDA